MKDCLEQFCDFSGQKVNYDKSSIVFSTNTPSTIKNQVQIISEMSITSDLGKYLGVPLTMQRINKNTYRETLDKVRSKLANWKASQLSLAGRLTLIHSASASIPMYQMQVAKIPSSVCNEIDRSHRNFLWGSTEQSKKIHLVNWNQVCQPKDRGGLGLRSMEDVNNIILAKLAWRAIQDPNSLWASVLCKK